MGDQDSIYGFAAVGLDVIPTPENAEAARMLKNLADGGYAVIYMTERLFEYLKTEIDEYNDAVIPAIIPIPDSSGSTGLGVSMVKKSVERAIGSDILFDKKGAK
jgi:V/A-type H+-transporting ATPase subunit F